MLVSNSKGKKAIIVFCVLILSIITSCVKDTTEDIITEELQKESLPITITEEVESDKEEITYDFLDVYGNSYTAILLEDIPMHEYNYDQLNIEEFIYTYEDTNGNITSAVVFDTEIIEAEGARTIGVG